MNVFEKKKSQMMNYCTYMNNWNQYILVLKRSKLGVLILNTYTEGECTRQL